MRVRPLLALSVAFNLGVLTTLACSTDGSAALAEAVAATVRAIDVVFDDAQAGLDTTTVQGALDVVDARTDALEAAAPTVEARVKALETTSETVEALNTATTALAKTDAGFETRLAALEALKVQLAAMETRLATAESRTEAAFTCPPETDRIGSTCMERSARPAHYWSSANEVCATAGGRLCTPGEYSTACWSLKSDIDTNNEPEFTSALSLNKVGVSGQPQFAVTEGEACDVQGDPINESVDLRAYRCCFDRINLGPE